MIVGLLVILTRPFMADIADTTPFAVGDKVQYFISYFDAPPKWYSTAIVVAVNPPTTDNANETYDISSTFSVPAFHVSITGAVNHQHGVRPYREREPKVGQICEYILNTDENGNATTTMPYTIVSKQNDGALVLNFTQRGMPADHLHHEPDLIPFMALIMVVNQLSPIALICIVMIVCTDNVISHDETGK